MATFAGDVEVTVVPDTSGFGEKLRAKVDPAAAAAAERIGRQMGQIIAARVADGVKSGLERVNTAALGARAGNQFGRAFAAAANTKIREALKDQSVNVGVDLGGARAEIQRFRQSLRDMPDVRIRVDSGDVTRTVGRIRTQMERLGNKHLSITVDADLAMLKLDRIRDRLREIGALRPTVRVDADTAAASAQLAGIQRQVTGLRGATVNVGANTSRARAGMQSLIALAVALSPALIGVGAAGTTAMAGIAAAAVAAAGGVGVLVLALAPVVGAYQALGKAQAQSGAAATSGASKAIALANANDSLKQAVQGVARAKRDAAEAAEQADRKIADSERDVEEAVRASIRTQADGAQRVADARRRVADQVRRAADVQVQSDRRIEDAERRLADAQEDVLRAQQDLNEARGLAARDAEDLASRVAGGRLDERDAVLDLADAEAELASASAEDRERAQLAYDRAVQRLQDIRRENQRLAQEQAESAQAGVEGSDRVTSAREALAEAERRAAEAAETAAEAAKQAARDREDAAQGVADAERGVAEAVEEAAERQRQAAIKVAGARRDLSDAVKADQDQQVKSAEAIAQAQQQVVQAQRGVQSATISAGAAGGAAMDEARKKMAALTPEGRAFVLFLRDEFVPAVKGLSGVAQTGLLPGLQEGMRSLLPLMPVFRDLVGSVSEAMGTLFREAGQALQGPFWAEFFAFMRSTAGPGLLTFGRTLGQLVEALAGLGIAFQPLADQFGRGLLNLTTRFADFAKSAEDNPAFQRFLAYVLENGPKVVDTFGSIFNAVGNIIRALAPMSGVVLAVVKGFADLIAATPPGVLEGITLAIIGITLAVKGWQFAQLLLNSTMLANPTFWVIAGLVALGAALVAAYQHSETFREIVDKVWAAVKTAVTVAWTDYIKPALEAMWGFVKGTLIPIFQWLWQNVIVPVWAGIRLAIETAWGIIKTVFNAINDFIAKTLIPAFRTYLQPAVELAWSLIKTSIEIAWKAVEIVFKAIVFVVEKTLGPIFKWLYEKIIKPVWDNIYTAISITWTTLIKPVLEAVGKFVKEHVAPGFALGVEAIKTAWNKLVDVAKVPVRFLVEQVINKGIIVPFNAVAKAFGVDPVKEVTLPAFFQDKKTPVGDGLTSGRGGRIMRADGGEIPGNLGTPGVDSVPALLMPNEHVWTTAEVRGAGGHAAVGRLRYMAAAGLLRGYAAGGAVQAGLSGLIGDPAGYLRDKVNAFIAKIADFGDGAFVKLLTAVPKKLLNMAIDRLGGLFSPDSGGDVPGGAVTGGVGWKNQWALVRGQFPNAVLTSAFRPGSITSSGNRSYHAMGRAIDVSPSMAIFNWIRDTFGATSKELIFTPAGGRQIKNGRPYVYGGQVAQDHYNHVHWAYDQGGYLPEGLSMAYNGTGRPEPVFTDAQWQTLTARGMGGPTYNFNGDIINPVPEPPSESRTRVMRRLAAVGPRG